MGNYTLKQIEFKFEEPVNFPTTETPKSLFQEGEKSILKVKADTKNDLDFSYKVKSVSSEKLVLSMEFGKINNYNKKD